MTRRIKLNCALALVIFFCALSGSCARKQLTLPQDVAAAMAALPENIDYNWDVRPLLSENCLRCHGHDPGPRKAGLRLDVKEGAYGPLSDNPKLRAVVPHDPARSQLVRRILSEDPDWRMPTPASHRSLSARDKAVFIKWIEQGARYDRHWAFVPPRVRKPASSAWDRRVVNPIDAYIFANLQRQNLAPAPEAERETLINRVTLDLSGLPPTLEEVDAFLKDERPDAYERVVDRLLASPAYGERMATAWMDAARYGDSDGYLDDNFGHPIYPWRDWVIAAFNRNMPFDQFATWQLAGDLLPTPTREQLIATTFGRLGSRSTENGITDEEYRVDYRNERSELVGKVFMGMTVQCAKCHDHKYDAITQADYYSLAGFFNSIDERGFYPAPYTRLTSGPTLPLPTRNQQKAWDESKATLAASQSDYQKAREASVSAARARVNLRVHAAPAALARGLQADLDLATVAYYPLDDTFEGSLESIRVPGFGPGQIPAQRAKFASLPPAQIPGVPGDEPTAPVAAPAFGPPVGPPPKSTARVEVKRPREFQPGPGQEALQPAGPPGKFPPLVRMLPDTFKEQDLRLSHGGRAEDPPAVINKAVLVPGAKGQALLMNDTVGFLGPRDVGKFERTQSFSLDLWIKPRAERAYGAAMIAYNQDHGLGIADSGYDLLSDHDRVRFDLVHVSPFNMISVVSKELAPRGAWTHVTVTYDGSSRAAGAKMYFNGKPVAVDIDHDNLTRSMLPNARFGSVALGAGYYGFSFGKRFRSEQFTGGAIDEIRIFDRALVPLEVAYLHDPRVLAGATAERLSNDLLALEIDREPRVASAAAALAAAKDRENQIASKLNELMILRDQPKVRPTYLLERGLFDRPSREVEPQALASVLPWNAKLSRDRRGLAAWLFDPDNPLTARVFVNRLWQQHMGSGIVQTVEDFGVQGSLPSNPLLLDWLAVEFMRANWDVKHMQKLIVMSATYRQSSVATPEKLNADPGNTFYARGPRFRMSAEQIRDNALFASGLLVDRKGGDSVFPYQPEGVWAAGAGANLYPDSVPDDDQHRRTMYTFIKRASPAPSMAVFDQPDRTAPTLARRISNTPLQALVLLNDVQFVEAYRKLAERVLLQQQDADAQLVHLFRLATRRHPVPEEEQTLRDYYAAEVTRFSRQPEAASQLLRVGVAPVAGSVDHNRSAALTMVAAAVMNSPDAYSIR